MVWEKYQKNDTAHRNLSRMMSEKSDKNSVDKTGFDWAGPVGWDAPAGTATSIAISIRSARLSGRCVHDLWTGNARCDPGILRPGDGKIINPPE